MKVINALGKQNAIIWDGESVANSLVRPNIWCFNAFWDQY